MALLISGHFGSGKSLLRKVCNTHPEINITDEFHSFDQIDVPYSEHVHALKLRSSTTRLWHYKHWGWLALYLSLIWMRSLRDGLVSANDVEVVLSRLDRRRASIVGDAYVRYTLNLGQLVAIPGLKLVVIYRDCRDIAATIEERLRRKKWYSFLHSPEPPAWIERLATPQRVAESWLLHIEAMEKHRDSVYLIRYEDLVAQPQRVLTELGNWLGVNPNQFEYDFTHADEVGAYEQVLTGQEVADILTIAGPTLERLGYGSRTPGRDENPLAPPFTTTP